MFDYKLLIEVRLYPALWREVQDLSRLEDMTPEEFMERAVADAALSKIRAMEKNPSEVAQKVIQSVGAWRGRNCAQQSR